MVQYSFIIIFFMLSVEIILHFDDLFSTESHDSWKIQLTQVKSRRGFNKLRQNNTMHSHVYVFFG